MKFYRMSNRDIVTDLRPIIGTTALRATRVYNAKWKQYCFHTFAYTDGIKAKLSDAQTATLKQILNRLLHEAKALPDPDDLEPRGGISTDKIRRWLNEARRRIANV